MTMDRRNRDRLMMSVFCRITRAGSHRKGTWKRIENISGTGMLLVWSSGETDIKPPNTGERFTVELQLPAHPVFGQKAMQFETKVVRVFRQLNGRVMVGFESTRTRFKFIRPAPWAEDSEPAMVN
jgi:c-di-GMP-binding flagellar brake protein YcgR